MVAAAWRDVYPAPHPALRVPWVGVPGNRDYAGNVSALAALAAVDPYWRIVGGEPRVVDHAVEGGVHYVVSGAGSLVDEPGRRWGVGGRFSIGTHAFVAASVSDDALTLTVVDYAGHFLYEAVIPPWVP
ncbi:hypothetical protein I4F81_003179 [Pyropia yezoensis]|uniref:Uncharacterized protein n=1 Tax=Pyropia yezoensis TaxID=2788 RepID=A0ACC3BSA8_PYRYE|nr:hypothetical protein I4F81_003179 [Neopyropia yezoensis]